MVSGEEEIVYTNRSSDTLREILFKLYPNLYKKGSPRLVNIQPEDIGEGVRISQLLVDGALQKPADLLPQSTNWTVPIQPLAPQQTVRFGLRYSYTLSQNSHMRTGAVDSSAWFIAYFFPRIAVYDDLDGWNRHPYLGTQEFYNDFCDFQLAVTVPKDYVVWATGDLLDCAEVLAPGYCQRLAQAETSDGLDQMEYPMMVNDNPVEDRTEAITLTDHEIFHTMFPFYVGTNETKYGWLGDDWATSGEWLISPMIDSNIVDDYGVVEWQAPHAL